MNYSSDGMNAGAVRNCLSREEDKDKSTPSDQLSHPSQVPSFDSAKEYSTQQPPELKGSSDSNHESTSNSDKEKQ